MPEDQSDEMTEVRTRSLDALAAAGYPLETMQVVLRRAYPTEEKMASAANEVVSDGEATVLEDLAAAGAGAVTRASRLSTEGAKFSALLALISVAAIIAAATSGSGLAAAGIIALAIAFNAASIAMLRSPRPVEPGVWLQFTSLCGTTPSAGEAS